MRRFKNIPFVADGVAGFETPLALVVRRSLVRKKGRTHACKAKHE